MSSLSKIEAIVLQAIPFKDYDRILTLFSPQGIVKLIVKARKGNYLHFAALTSPLTQAEFHYSPGRKDLHRLYEGGIIKQHLHIRDRYETLIAAEQILQALLRSQWPGKPAPKLYHLFQLFLDYLPQCADPALLTTAFLIKTLMHEGVLQLLTPAADTYRFAGECYASQPPVGSLPFSAQEEQTLILFALSRSLSLLASQTPTPSFHNKIATLFEQAFG